MYKVKFTIYFSLLFAFIFILACNKPEEVKLDFLNTDWIYAKGIDTFTLAIKSYKKDSIETLNETFQNSSIVVGILDDPMFGYAKSSLNTQLRFTPEKDNLFLSRVDSIVLSMRYDTSTFYGNTDEPMSIEVYQMKNPIYRTQTYYNNSTIILGEKLGEKMNFTPNKKDSVKINTVDSFTYLYPQLRVNLDKTKFIDLLNQLADTALQDVDTFVQIFAGISIVPVQNRCKGMIGLLPEHQDSKITIYYKPTDTTHAQFTFNMGSASTKFASFETDPKNTLASQYISGLLNTDSLFMVQCFNGPEAEIVIPYSDSWTGKFLNYAVLDFTVAELSGDNLLQYKPIRLATMHDLTIGHEGEVRDVFRAKNESKYIPNGLFIDYRNYFGGILTDVTENGQKLRHCKMNITEHFRVAQRQKKDIRIRLSSYFKTESAERTIFYGPKHPQYPAKLRLTFSE